MLYEIIAAIKRIPRAQNITVEVLTPDPKAPFPEKSSLINSHPPF